ncbi:hypothetical protein OROMI_033862 [Orobanche minor]
MTCWTFKRKNLAQENRKVMLTGYESTVGDIRCCLESFGKQAIREMTKSVFGNYMKLPDIVTRSGKVLHYMISRQVTPRPELDKTSLWFKVKGKVLRFSRVEFVLISGLKFGPAKINPYMMNDKIPVDSVYAWILDSTLILPVNLRTKFIDKKFKVNKVEVKGSEADYLKLAKVLMASMYVVGLDTNKTKIPNWMWALVEDNEAWEQFPWGSLSYQFLIAFLAWIYEVKPSIGLKFGGRMDQEKRPRMLRYRYSTASDFPEYPSMELISVLEPSERELNTDYWKKRNEDEDEEEVVPVGDGASTSTANAQLLPPNILVSPDRKALIKEIGDYVGEIAAKRERIEVEALLRIHEEKLIAAVGEYVVRRLSEMERTPADVTQATERQAMEQPTASVAEATEGGTNAYGITIPTIEKATGQEMLDPSDTQMNGIYDELVCLGEVTPPVQGILPGAVGPREALEQPATEKMIAMNDDITPPAQSILTCAVGSSRHAPIMVSPLKTPTALAIPKVILNVRPIRRRFPAAVIRSPFLHDDIRGGDTFDHYLRLEDGGM